VRSIWVSLDRLLVCYSLGRFGFSRAGTLFAASAALPVWPKLGWKTGGT